MTSKFERESLAYMEECLGKKIRTQFSHPDGQKKVGNYHLDGYIESENKAIEFLGRCVLSMNKLNLY